MVLNIKYSLKNRRIESAKSLTHFDVILLIWRFSKFKVFSLLFTDPSDKVSDDYINF
jgi:hypothetical protein